MKTIKNYAYNLVYQIFMILLPLILSPYISRVVGPEGVGLFSYSRSIVEYFGFAALLGMTMYGNRFIASVEHDRESLSKNFFEMFEIQLVCLSVVVCSYLIYIYFFSGEYQSVFKIMFFYMFGLCIDIGWFYFGIGEFKIPVIRNVLVKLVTFIAIFTFVKGKDDTLTYILILSLSNFFTFFLLWVYLPHYIDLKPQFFINLKKTFIPHFKNIVVLFIPVIATKIYKSVDRVMIGNVISITEVGYYENAQSIIETIVYVLTALGTVMLPLLTKMYVDHKEEQAHTYLRYSFHMITFISVGAMFGVMGVAKTFVPLFYGEKFYPTIQLLQMLAPTLIFIGWADIIRTQYLLPKYRDKDYIFAIIVGMALNLAVNALLIPSLKSVGAVIGTLAAEMSVFVIQAYYVRKSINLEKIFKAICPYFLFGLVMYFIIIWIDTYAFSLFARCLIEIMVGGIIYGIMSILYLFNKEKELYALVWKRVKK